MRVGGAVGLGSADVLIPLVLLAALLHASWNALVRASGDRLIVLACVNFTGVMIGAAGVLLLPAPAAVLHTGYYIYLLKAYDRGELIQVYPLARGAAPLLITLSGALIAGEFLGPLASLGVALASFGIILLSFEAGPPWRR